MIRQAVWICALLALGGTVVASDGDGRVERVNEYFSVAIETRLVATKSRNGVDQASSDGTHADSRLRIGESVSPGIGARRAGSCFVADRTSLDELLGKTDCDYVWFFRYTLEPSDMDRIRLTLDWERHDLDAEGRFEKTAGDRRTLDLHDGGRYVLDHVRTGEDMGVWRFRNYTIEIVGHTIEDDRFEHEQLEYDLWYRHTDARGRVTTRHAELLGRQGEDLELTLAPVRFAVEAGMESIVELAPSITGRVREDGQIEIVLEAFRWYRVVPAGGWSRGGIGDGGRKRMVIEPGETISLKLPRLSEVHPTARVGNWIDLNDNERLDENLGERMVTVPIAEFYAEHDDEFILTVHHR